MATLFIPNSKKDKMKGKEDERNQFLPIFSPAFFFFLSSLRKALRIELNLAGKFDSCVQLN